MTTALASAIAYADSVATGSAASRQPLFSTYDVPGRHFVFNTGSLLYGRRALNATIVMHNGGPAYDFPIHLISRSVAVGAYHVAAGVGDTLTFLADDGVSLVTTTILESIWLSAGDPAGDTFGNDTQVYILNPVNGVTHYCFLPTDFADYFDYSGGNAASGLPCYFVNQTRNIGFEVIGGIYPAGHYLQASPPTVSPETGYVDYVISGDSSGQLTAVIDPAQPLVLLTCLYGGSGQTLLSPSLTSRAATIQGLMDARSLGETLTYLDMSAFDVIGQNDPSSNGTIPGNVMPFTTLYTIGTGGTYATFDAAFNQAVADAITGDVHFRFVSAGPFTPAGSYDLSFLACTRTFLEAGPGFTTTGNLSCATVATMQGVWSFASNGGGSQTENVTTIQVQGLRFGGSANGTLTLSLNASNSTDLLTAVVDSCEFNVGVDLGAGTKSILVATLADGGQLTVSNNVFACSVAQTGNVTLLAGSSGAGATTNVGNLTILNNSFNSTNAAKSVNINSSTGRTLNVNIQLNYFTGASSAAVGVGSLTHTGTINVNVSSGNNYYSDTATSTYAPGTSGVLASAVYTSGTNFALLSTAPGYKLALTPPSPTDIAGVARPQSGNISAGAMQAVYPSTSKRQTPLVAVLSSAGILNY